MPSQLHEALALLFRECPDLGVVLARDVLGVSIPAGSTVEAVAAEFADLDPPEYRADAVLRVDGPGGQAADVLIIEVQLQTDADKSFSWLSYVAGARQRFRCPATIVVVTPDERVARWAEQPVAVDRAGTMFRPLVLGPSRVPAVTNIERALALPELAVLSAVMHSREDEAADVGAAALLACRQFDDTRGRIYADIIYESLGEIARAALEKLMDLRGYQYPQSEIMKKPYYDGQRDALRHLLAQKFSDLPSEITTRIDLAEPEELLRWLERLVNAESLEDVFTTES